MSEVIMNEASFKNACILKDAVLDLVNKKEIELSSLLGLGTYGDMLGNLIKIDTDKKCHEAIFECLKSFKVDEIPVTEELMTVNREVRNDYYKLIKECLTLNLLPFIESLNSLLQEE